MHWWRQLNCKLYERTHTHTPTFTYIAIQRVSKKKIVEKKKFRYKAALFIWHWAVGRDSGSKCLNSHQTFIPLQLWCSALFSLISMTSNFQKHYSIATVFFLREKKRVRKLLIICYLHYTQLTESVAIVSFPQISHQTDRINEREKKKTTSQRMRTVETNYRNFVTTCSQKDLQSIPSFFAMLHMMFVRTQQQKWFSI